MENPAVEAYNFTEKIEEESPVVIVAIDVPPLVAAACDMPYRTRMLEAKRTRHFEWERREGDVTAGRSGRGQVGLRFYHQSIARNDGW